VIDLSAPGCRRHRAALVDFIDRREIGPGTESALDHLARCRACEWELESTALAITALRRLYGEIRTAEPPADAWLRLRSRIERPRAALWRWRTTLAGIAVGAGLVGTLLAPRAIWSPKLDVPTDGNWTSPYLDDAGPLEWNRLLDRRQAQSPITILVPLDAPPTGMRWGGPDGRGYVTTASVEAPPPGRAH
jgi:hypothetical protein